MEEINVTRGCSPHNDEKHCSDGDSTYLNGKFVQDVAVQARE